ncbi:MAG: peptide ABC transporter substrate-binding protein [Anaerolineae bacterium]|nr:peptide ABC transporter substrate-binding protein [Anaerolineae bacterium]MCQ3976976.1 peptide ABC transporter substrate-binding protein [Anaerolineae bacterium]
MKNKIESSKNSSVGVIVIGLTLVAILTGCGAAAVLPPTAEPTQAVTVTPTEATSRRGQGETLTLFFFQAPTTANPHLSPGDKDLSASRIAYEPLASFDKEGNLTPFLATEIPSLDNGGVAPDGTSVTWKLRDDVKWADGQPFTAADVLFTYHYVTNPAVNASSTSAYQNIENVEAIDNYTVKVNFNKPTAAWYAPFVGPFGMIIPRHLFEAYSGANAADAPHNLTAIGTGPYYVSEWRNEDVLIIGGNAVSTNKIIYETNPYYRDFDKPFFSQVELRGGGDLDLAVQAGKEGTADFVWNTAVSEEKTIDAESTGKSLFLATPSSFVERIMINFTDPRQESSEGERASIQFPHPFLSDLNVRRAMAMAINRAVIAGWYGRGGKPTTNILAEPPYYASTKTRIEYNPQKAAELLRQAGWVDTNGDGVREKEGVELRLEFQTSIQNLRQQTQEQVKKDLEAIGFAVELKQIDSSIFFGPPADTTDTRRQFYSDLEEFAFSNKSPDPTAYMAGWSCDNIAQKENDWALPNWGRYCNPEFDRLFHQVSTELNPDHRIELFVQMNELLIDDVAVIPLVQLANPVAVSVELQGYNFTAWDVEVWDIANWYK